ncbi:MAG TPA: LysE family transporter [Burkholderiales bacterium]|nr:LysE family transporter [Burkholderiales bacterium]
MTLEALRAFLFGVAIAAPVGPIALLLIHTGLNHRLSAALWAALGVALADLTYAVLALAAGSGLVRLLHVHQGAFRLASSGALILLGLWLATRALREPAARAATAPERTRHASGLIQLYLLTLANPLTILLFAAFSGQMPACGGVAAVVSGSLCLFLGSLAVQTGYASFGAALRRWVATPSTVRKINAMSGIAIAAFGAWGLGSATGA